VGNEKIPAMTLGLVFRAPASVLDGLHEELRPTLYKHAENHASRHKKEKADGDLLPDNPDDMTERRFKNVPALSYNDKLPGYSLAMNSGLTDSIVITQKNVTLSKFSITPLDGGTVEIQLNVAMHPDKNNAGEFCHMVQQTMQLNLRPPEVPEQADIEDTQE
jgi:hypothetical protein